MIDARTHTRREGNKGEKNGLLKMGSSMSKWGLTPPIPSDIEESGHGKDGPNAYRLQPYPYGLSGRNARFSRRDIPISWGFFWVLSLRKNRSPSFFGSVANFHLSRFRV